MFPLFYCAKGSNARARDSINAIFCFPRVYNDKIIESLLEFTNPRLSKVRTITERVIHLRKLIESHHQHHFNASFIAREIEEPLADLHHKLRALRVIDDSYTRATSISIELALYILWPSQSAAHLTLLAEELKTAISKFPIKGCSFMNLTSFQLVIGAISAETGSSTRKWYIQCLASEVKAMQLRGWRDPLNLLQSRDKYAGTLKDTLGALWDELYSLASEE